MHTMISKFVTQEFMTEAEGQYIENAINRKETIIVSGHRSAGTRQLMAALMAVAKSSFTSTQVKGFGDLDKDVEYFLIPGIDNLDFEKLISDAMTKQNAAFVSVKEPEHPYSIMKLLKNVYKLNNDSSKVYQVLECAKIDNVPRMTKITSMKLDEEGKLIKEDFEG